MNYLFVLLLPLALLEMKIWLSVRDWIDILDVSCGPWLIDISFFFFFFRLLSQWIALFPARVLSFLLPLYNVIYSKKRFFRFLYRVLLSFRPCQEYFFFSCCFVRR